jgi:hypothetical protein
MNSYEYTLLVQSDNTTRAEGAIARRRGVTINPWPVDHPAHKLWQEGYDRVEKQEDAKRH